MMWGVGIQKNKKTFCEFGHNTILALSMNVGNEIVENEKMGVSLK